MISELIRQTLKEGIGKHISFRNFKNFYFEGIIIDCDDSHLKYNDRKTGLSIISLDEIKTVEGLK